MIRQSFFDDLVLDTPEAMANMERVLKRYEEGGGYKPYGKLILCTDPERIARFMAAGRDQQTSGPITVSLRNLLRDHSESNVAKRLSTFAWGDAIDVIDRVRQIVGCRLIGPYCTDSLVESYRENGFTHIGRDATDDRNHMVAFIGLIPEPRVVHSGNTGSENSSRSVE